MNDLWNSFWRWAYGKALEALTTPAGGVGVSMDLGSGYAVEEDRMQKVANLKALCDEAVANPAWVAHDITGDGKAETFCNRAARFIAEGMGFFAFPANTAANQLIAILAIHPDCREDTVERAHAHAMRGGLAFLTLTDDPHGHIPVIYPAPMQPSGTWGEDVPMLANVGAKNGVMKASEVYRLGMKPFLRAFLVGETA